MSIIGNLPDNLTNGTTADASQVMADLNFIVNQVNANAVPTNVTSLANLNSLPSLTALPTVTSVGASLAINGNSSINIGSGSIAAEIDVILNNNNTAGQFYLNDSGVSGFYDITRTFLRWSSDTSGNFTAAGNITAYSDERLKKDWKPVYGDFVQKLALVKSGTFTRTDTGERQAGVSAQALQEVLPEAVQGTDVLSVAYGQAALVACVELAKEVLRLRALLEPVK